MRVLIDECLDWRLAKGLPGYDVTSVARMGWAGVKNGRLIALAEQQFDLFITGDQNLSFQQNVSQLRIAIVILSATSTQLRDTLPLMEKLLKIGPHLPPGSVTVLTP